MKKLFRSVFGKILLIILFTAALCLLIGCGLEIAFCAENSLYQISFREYTKLWNLNLQYIYISGIPSELLYHLRYWVFAITAFAITVLVASFTGLMTVAGRNNRSEEPVPGVFAWVPYDVILICCVTLEVGLAYAMDELFNYLFPATAFIIIYMAWVFLLAAMSFASRVKLHTLIKGSLIYIIGRLLFKGICAVVRFLGKILRAVGRFLGKVFKLIFTVYGEIPMVWKTVVVLVVLSVLELLGLAATTNDDFIYVLWIIEKVVIVPIILYAVISMRKLQHTGQVIAVGNLNYHMDTTHLYGDFKKHAESLNSISDGMSKAVDLQMKSERMKTELITNVSHDIKTPLTSIINYASLIDGEPCENEKIHEYSSVLVRQSEKLKRLIEDLVEASKASTGNLEIAPMPCDAATLVSQASGEYEEKLQNAGLSLVTSVPEQPISIMADSRRMWRIFDNLFNNICKYSQPGTRVYLSLENVNGSAVFTFRNTSKDELNISADELLERFVRGDSSRNTEGNGLGLSIARSLTELQKGKLDLYIDGDLFKVVLSFPIV